MVTSSKILTVTYGTFSCTLEGFDDPFTTLQMVAEYFRKLAAEDRYFGGTPQTPDAETLTRIAQENNPKGVDAEIGDDGIILRQAERPEQAVPQGDPDDAPEVSDDDAVAEAVVVADDSAPALDVAAENELVFDSTRNAPETDDDPMAALKAELDQTVDEPVTPPDTDQISQAVNAALADQEPAKPAASPLTFFSSRRQDNTAKDQDTADDHAIEAAISAAGLAAAVRQPPPAVTPQKSVEETLAAIRQNVEQAESSITDAEDRDAGIEDHDDEADEEAEDISEPLVLTSDAEVEVDDVSDQEPLIAAEIIADTIVAEEDPVQEVMAEEFIAEDVEVEEPAVEETTAEEPTAEVEVAQDIVAEDPVAEEAEPDAPEVDFWDEPLVAEVAEPAIAQEAEEVEAVAEDAPTEEVAQEKETPIPANSSLSDEQEAELAADLQAALDARDQDSETAELDAVERALSDPQTAARRRRADLLRNGDVAHEDEALNRLLETTQSKMDKPEQVRRMNALDQLKAAVAATEADQMVRRQSVAATHSEAADDEAADLAAYREDLRRAQNSARLEGLKTAKTQRPAPAPAAAAIQQAPLILVSEQRINDPAPGGFPGGFEEETAEPMQEVAETDGNLALKPEFHAAPEAADDEGEIQGIPADAFSDATSFADFAERIGAFDLTDLLEASAAYTSIVEGKSRFSRAQVMSKLAKLNTGDAYSKEAGLRSFGKLLREGKILRVQDGQFGISKASRFSIASRYNE